MSILFSSSALQRPPIPFEICLFRIITGLPCPSCGMTRSFIHMGHFHLGDALYFNVMGPFLYLSVAIALVVSLYEFIYRKPVLTTLWQKYRHPLALTVCLAATASWAWNIYKKIAGFSLGY